MTKREPPGGHPAAQKSTPTNYNDPSRRGLHIPDVNPDADMLSWALAYVEAGWYVLPVKRGSKSPGSVVGDRWQYQSSRDPKVLAAWFAGTDHGIVLHCGRSGAVVFDVDYPNNLPEVLARHLDTAPFQSTRPDVKGRGHYVFSMPPGRTIGNSTGSLGGGWGEVRGTNGVILVEPTGHPDGGEYWWDRTGELPPLPEELAELLSDASPAHDAATDAAVRAFIAEHTARTEPGALRGLLSALRRKFEAGESRHMSTLSVTTGAMKEARAGLYTPREAIDAVWPMFLDAVTKPPASGKQGAARDHTEASSEFGGITAWAVGQALAADPDEIRDRVAADGQVADIESAPTDGQVADTEFAIAHRLHVLRINAEARRRLEDEQHPQAVPPPIKGLDTLLAEPDTPTRYRIDDVAPEGARIILSAQYKAGKTTLRDNLVRSLADGDPFLGRFEVNIGARHIVLIDTELSENMLRRWLRDQKITNTTAVADVVALRGKVASFNLLDDRCRSQWVSRLADLGCDYLLLDPLRPVLDAIGLDESHDVGRFLVAYDALLDEAGVTDTAIVHHMGHTGERARGDSRLQDWPDAVWRLVREDDDPASPRYFTAIGRDVNVFEGRLGFDHATRRLTYAPGSRGDAKVEAAFRAVIATLAQRREAMSKNALETELLGAHTRDAVRAAIAKTVRSGMVVVEVGPRNARLHSIAYPCSECGLPVTSQGPRHRTCPAGPEDLELELELDLE
jgi:bifunctional DNA primase/polymerase-like protein/AAA domain-containing protein